jgi:uncharacterized protein with von Willebrand factor type A (vWA) domain
MPAACWPRPSATRLAQPGIRNHAWGYTRTIIIIRQIFPMFELSIDGLEKAVSHLTR